MVGRETPVPSAPPAAAAAAALGRVGAQLAADLASPAAARRLVAKALANWGLEQLADVALLLTSEVVTNAVQHAGTTLHVTVTRREEGVRVEVVDLRPTERPRVQDAAPDADGGRGLALLDALSTRWSVTANGAMKCVWFEVDVGQPPAAGSR